MIRIGKIVAAHGLNGTLILTHVLGSHKWLKKGQPLMVEMKKDSYIPYFISAIKVNGEKEFYINIEDITKVEDAKKLVTKYVFIDPEKIKEYAKKSPLLWIGFKVKDIYKGELGVIEDVFQTATQWLGKMTYQDAEVLLPLIEQMIEKVDIKAKEIVMELPEGLLEIYTSK